MSNVNEKVDALNKYKHIAEFCGLGIAQSPCERKVKEACQVFGGYYCPMFRDLDDQKAPISFKIVAEESVWNKIKIYLLGWFETNQRYNPEKNWIVFD